MNSFKGGLAPWQLLVTQEESFSPNVSLAPQQRIQSQPDDMSITHGVALCSEGG
jgi:hypothetical protein